MIVSDRFRFIVDDSMYLLINTEYVYDFMFMLQSLSLCFRLGRNDRLRPVLMLETSGMWNQGSLFMIRKAKNTACDFGPYFVTHWYLVPGYGS
jgi:hypothetical protein